MKNKKKKKKKKKKSAEHKSRIRIFGKGSNS